MKLGITFFGRATHLQFSSVAQSCPTLCDPMNRSTPGLPVHHQLPESTQTHVHCLEQKPGAGVGLASWLEHQAICCQLPSRCDLQQAGLRCLQPSSNPPWFSHRIDGLVYWMSGSKAGLPNMWFRSLNPQGDSLSPQYPCLSGSHTRCVSPNQIASPLFLPDSVWIFL